MPQKAKKYNLKNRFILGGRGESRVKKGGSANLSAVLSAARKRMVYRNTFSITNSIHSQHRGVDDANNPLRRRHPLRSTHKPNFMSFARMEADLKAIN